jgi:hemerythrin
VTLLTWNHACTIGVRAMDDQHAVLMDTLNELRLTLVHGGGREQVGEVLVRLIDFTRMHFSCEERLLEAHGYPGIELHREAHRRLMIELESVAQRAAHQDELHMRALLLFLRDWYLSHVADLDSEYGTWLNERGIA